MINRDGDVSCLGDNARCIVVLRAEQKREATPRNIVRQLLSDDPKLRLKILAEEVSQSRICETFSIS